MLRPAKVQYETGACRPSRTGPFIPVTLYGSRSFSVGSRPVPTSKMCWDINRPPPCRIRSSLLRMRRRSRGKKSAQQTSKLPRLSGTSQYPTSPPHITDWGGVATPAPPAPPQSTPAFRISSKPSIVSPRFGFGRPLAGSHPAPKHSFGTRMPVLVWSAGS